MSVMSALILSTQLRRGCLLTETANRLEASRSMAWHTLADGQEGVMLSTASPDTTPPSHICLLTHTSMPLSALFGSYTRTIPALALIGRNPSLSLMTPVLTAKATLLITK